MSADVATTIDVARTLLKENEIKANYRFMWEGEGVKRKLFLLKCRWRYTDNGTPYRCFTLCDQASMGGVVLVSWECELTPDGDCALKGETEIDNTMRSFVLQFEAPDDVDFPQLSITQPSKAKKIKMLRSTSNQKILNC